MTLQTLRVVIGVCCLNFWACAWGGATAMTVPVKEVDFPADDQQPIWLDNTHVLFSGGFSGAESHSAGQARDLGPGLYSWDLEKQTTMRESRFNYLSHLCVNGRFMSYTPLTNERKLGKRQAFIDGQQVDVPDTYWFNRTSCRIHTTKPPWEVEGRSIVPLLEEHGYIDFGLNGEAGIEEIPLQYYRPGVVQPVTLRLKSRYVMGSVHYVPFLDAYVLHSSSGHNSARPLWLLHPNGTVEQVFSPEGKAWAEQSFSWEVLTKRGVVFGKITNRGSEVRDSGLYLWENGALTQVVSGVFSLSAAVSPDGCKLAGIKGRLKRPLPGNELYRLQIIDVCQGGPNVP